MVAIPLAVVLAGGISLYGLNEQEQRGEAAVRHTFLVRSQIRTLLNDLLTADTGVQGFLLTGREESLMPYEDAFVALPETLAKLEALVGNNPSQLERARRIRFLTGRKLELLASLRELPATEGVDPSEMQEDLVIQSEATTNELRSELEAMRLEEDRLLEARLAVVDRTVTRTRLTFVAAALLGLIGGIVAIVLFTRGVVRRVRRVEDNAHRLAEELPMLPLPAARDEIGRLGKSLQAAGTLLADREHRLLEAQAFLEQLIASSPVVILKTDLDERVSYVSPNVTDVLGYERAEVCSSAGFWLARVHPDDRERFRARVLEATNEPGWEGELEYRFRHADGSYRWLYSLERMEYDAHSGPLRLLGYALDVSRRKAAEEALAQRDAMLQTIYEISPDMITVFSDGHKRAYVSPGVREALGYEPEELTGENQIQIVHRDDQELDNQLLSQARSVETAVRTRVRLRHADGHWVWVDARACRMPGATPELADAVVLFERDVTTQVELEDALKHAKEQAEEASRAKSMFLSRTSHELRTPLNAILGFAQLLDMSDLHAQAHEHVEQILRGGNHLLRLMNDVLDIARIEAGELAMYPESVAVGELVHDSVELLRPVATPRDVHVSSEIARADQRLVLADRQRLSQILLNLLSNAIKYNHPGGQVTVSCHESGEQGLRIEVTDTGAGIPPERLDRLFTPFERLGAEQGHVEGTGLGLALSTRLAEAMGGSVGVRSQVGRGSTFWVQLPLVQGALGGIDVKTAPAAGEVAASHAERTVLYIEDNLSNFKLVEGVLAQRPGITLLSALQGGVGIDLARQHRPDLILLDLELPDLPGDEVLRRLQEDARTSDLDVIIVSADATQGKIEQLLDSGVRAYLTKPLDLRRFLDVIDETLRLRESTDRS